MYRICCGDLKFKSEESTGLERHQGEQKKVLMSSSP